MREDRLDGLADGSGRLYQGAPHVDARVPAYRPDQ